jgi:septum site-determining protein MinD
VVRRYSKSKDILNKWRISDKTRVVGIVSGKGGVGKTTFSANLGIALNAFGLKTLVIDCNVTTPHLSYYIGARNYSITLNNIFAGDIDAVFAPTDKEGLMFIPASERFNDLRNVDMRKLRNIIRRIAQTGKFDFIVLDSAPGLGREAIGTLQACDEIVFVTTPTAPNIMDIVRNEEVARLFGHKKFYMAFNMVRGKDYEITPEKAEQIFNIPVIGVIPFDETIMDATAQGVPIMWYKPDAESCDHFMYIAANLAGITLEGNDMGKIRVDEHWSEDDKRLEPIIEEGYRYYEKREKGGFGKKVDNATKGIVGKLKDALSR